jgi:hypothetical protein
MHPSALRIRCAWADGTLDKSRSDLTQANFAAETGKVRLCGELTLDYVPVRVVADIDLPSLQGQGHLEILAERRTA